MALLLSTISAYAVGGSLTHLWGALNQQQASIQMLMMEGIKFPANSQ